MKNRGGLIILAVIFFGLMIFTAVQVNRPRTITPPNAALDVPDVSQLAGGANRIYTNWGVEDIQAVQLYSPLNETTLTFNRTDDGWELPDINREPDQTVIDSLAETIAILPYTYQIQGIEPAQYPEFGLTQAGTLLFIRIIRTDDTLHMLAVGGLTPTDDGHYTLVDDRQEIYVVDRSAVAFLLYYLRDFEQNQ